MAETTVEDGGMGRRSFKLKPVTARRIWTAAANTVHAALGIRVAQFAREKRRRRYALPAQSRWPLPRRT